MKPRRIIWVAAVLLVAVGVLGGAYIVSETMIGPVPASAGEPPDWLPAEPVRIASASGSAIAGWHLDIDNPAAAVVLLHGVRGNRRSMLGRAKFLAAAGFALLLVDFQAHGESPGRRITFGHLESLDASAAVDFMRREHGDTPVFVIGSSLGGAAAVLADPPLAVDGMILEGVYADIQRAVKNRLRVRMGEPGARLAPVLTSQIRPRLGVRPGKLSPAARASEIDAPVFIISGARDLRTTVPDTMLLYDAFRSPKQLWVVPGARHQDLHAFASERYEQNVLVFISGIVSGTT